ncbi:hypothetical protein Tco_0510435 [Tanacetum coccineum]
MSSSSTVTYTSPIAPPSPDYVPGLEHPPSPDYVAGPEHPPSPVEVPYVPEPEYPEYLAPSDAEAPLEDQPLPADALPTALSPGYVADCRSFVLDLSSLSTILQSFSATLHISNIDYMYIKSYSFRLFSSLPVSHLLWSSQSFGHQKGACPWSTENHFNSQYMKHWASQSFGT